MTMLFDAVAIDSSNIRRTNDGYLVAESFVARTGIQLYTADELGMEGDPKRVIRVYRPPEEVFAADAMASYAHRPVTVDHPPVLVDATNWKEYSRGQTGDEVVRDGERVRVPLVLMDQAAISEWEDGKREWSMGYLADVEISDGETPEGEKYDAIQRNFRMNHLALVSRARGGSELRLGDDRKPEEPHMSDVKLKTVLVDGLSVETTEAGAQAIAKLTQDLAKARTDKETAAADHAKAMADKDRELATKDAEIDDLKGKVLNDADLDARVKERGDLIANAKRIADKDYTGMAPAEIRKAAVSAKLGQTVIDGKSDDYVQARFDILLDEAKQDPVRQHLRDGGNGNGGNGGQMTAEASHAQMVRDTENAWMGKTKEVA